LRIRDSHPPDFLQNLNIQRTYLYLPFKAHTAAKTHWVRRLDKLLFNILVTF